MDGVSRISATLEKVAFGWHLMKGLSVRVAVSMLCTTPIQIVPSLDSDLNE